MTSSAWTTFPNSTVSVPSASNASTYTRAVSKGASATRLPPNPCYISFVAMTTKANFCCRRQQLGKLQVAIWRFSIFGRGDTIYLLVASPHLIDRKIGAFMRSIYSLSIINICRYFIKNSKVKIIPKNLIEPAVRGLLSEKVRIKLRMWDSRKYRKSQSKYCKRKESEVKITKSQKSKWTHSKRVKIKNKRFQILPNT